MTIQTHKTEKKTLNVTVDGIKHSYHARGWPLTTLHLELASRPDLEFLQRAHAITKDIEVFLDVEIETPIIQTPLFPPQDDEGDKGSVTA